jgi:hypothetical protein
MRSLRVSSPVMKAWALNGDSDAPRSRNSSTRAFRMKDRLPKVSYSLRPW